MGDVETTLQDSKPDRHCIHCGYNLRGIAAEKCPECGNGIDTSLDSPIPWIHRKSLGFFRAFFRTLLLGTFRPFKLVAAFNTALEPRSVRGFHRLVLFLAWLAVAGPYIGFMVYNWQTDFPNQISVDYVNRSVLLSDPSWQFVVLWSAGATMAIVLPICLYIWLDLGTHFSLLPFRDATRARSCDLAIIPSG